MVGEIGGYCVGEIFLIWLLSGLIFGAIGVSIAKNKRVSTNTGFLLGFFLGPIGLIIVALLNPTVERIDAREEFGSTRDTASDAYRLWLTNKYGITRNDTLQRFVVGGESFPSLDEAIIHADGLEDQQVYQNQTDAADATTARKHMVYAVAGVIACVALLFLAKSVLSYLEHRKAVSAFEVAIEDTKKSIIDILRPAGLNLHPKSMMADSDYQNLPTDDLRSPNLIKASYGSPSGAYLDPCSVSISTTGATDRSGKTASFRVDDTPQNVLSYYSKELSGNNYAKTETFSDKYSDRIAFQNGNNVIFVSSIKPDDTPTIATICILSRPAMDKIAGTLAKIKQLNDRAQAEWEKSNRALRRQLGMPDTN